MTDEVTLDVETVESLIHGAGHLYYPAFPDDKERKAIAIAVTRAEGALEE